VKIVARTRRLFLREVVEADADALGPCFADPATMTFYPAPRDRRQTHAWIAAQRDSYAARGYGLWAACERATGAFAGYCGLAPQELDGRPEIEVGYLVRRDLWNRGLASEAARAVLRMARRRFPGLRPIALIDPENAASKRVAEKIGMLREGETRKWGKRLFVFRTVDQSVSQATRGRSSRT
jgi:RimJ/RimL family protein N-acetyltransferase